MLTFMWSVNSTLGVCLHKEIVIIPNYEQLTDKRIYLKQLIKRVYKTYKDLLTQMYQVAAVAVVLLYLRNVANLHRTFVI